MMDEDLAILYKLLKTINERVELIFKEVKYISNYLSAMDQEALRGRGNRDLAKALEALLNWRGDAVDLAKVASHLGVIPSNDLVTGIKGCLGKYAGKPTCAIEVALRCLLELAQSH